MFFMLVDVFEKSEKAEEQKKKTKTKLHCQVRDIKRCLHNTGLDPEKPIDQHRENLVCMLTGKSVDVTKNTVKYKEQKTFPRY